MTTPHLPHYELVTTITRELQHLTSDQPDQRRSALAAIDQAVQKAKAAEEDRASTIAGKETGGR